MSKQKGVGLDCGTMNLVAARRGEKKTKSRTIRDAYLTLPVRTKKSLKIGKVSYLERDDELLVLGNKALEIASGFGKEISRPLAAGLVASGDKTSQEVLALLIKEVLGPPSVPDEICCFSVPASPLNSKRDIVYHEGVLERIITACGYEAIPSNEAMAVVFSELEEESFTGLALSFGSGMVNAAISIQALSRLECSVAMGGDWIDAGVSNALGIPQAEVCTRKESGVNLLDPKDEVEEAIALYYKSLIREVLKQISVEFKAKFARKLQEPLTIVISGGTSLAGGFLEVFNQVLKRHKRKLPFEVAGVRAAKEPLRSVAYGLLNQALQEYEED